MQKQRTQLPKRNRKVQQIKIPEYIQKPQEANAALIYPMAQLLKAAAATGATAWAASKVNPETTKSIVDKVASYVQAAPVAIYNTYRTLTKPTGQGRVNNTAVQSGQTVVNDATAVQRPTIAYTRPHSANVTAAGMLMAKKNKGRKKNNRAAQQQTAIQTQTAPVDSATTTPIVTPATAPVQPEQNPEDKKPEEKKQEEETQQGEQTTQQKPELPKKGRWQRAREWAGNKIAGNTKPTAETPKDPEQWSTFTKLLLENQANNFGRILGTGYGVRNALRLGGAGYWIYNQINDSTNTNSINPQVKQYQDSIDIYKKKYEFEDLQNSRNNTQRGDTAVVNQKPTSNVEVATPTTTQNLGNPYRGTLH